MVKGDCSSLDAKNQVGFDLTDISKMQIPSMLKQVNSSDLKLELETKKCEYQELSSELKLLSHSNIQCANRKGFYQSAGSVIGAVVGLLISTLATLSVQSSVLLGIAIPIVIASILLGCNMGNGIYKAKENYQNMQKIEMIAEIKQEMMYKSKEISSIETILSFAFT